MLDKMLALQELKSWGISGSERLARGDVKASKLEASKVVAKYAPISRHE
jgi:hypothetical protein